QAERLRAAIARAPMTIADRSISIAASFGVTTAPDASRATPELLIHAADTALFQAKREGRNRVVFLPCREEQPGVAKAQA
ncbi:MAG: diguanylate cyclase, partial [Acidobacteria bacterium]|nr:diguanylate cyclase [Acidobacteriota bacterium]